MTPYLTASKSVLAIGFLFFACSDGFRADGPPEILWTAGGHSREVNAVTFSPDGQWIASASDDFSVKLWRTIDGALLRTFLGHTNDVQSVAFSPDGSELFSGGKDFAVRVWGVSDGTEWRSYQDARLEGDWSVDPRHLMALSPDGQLLVTGHSYLKGNPQQNTCVLRIRQMPGGRLKNEMRLDAVLNSMAFTPDGQWLALGQGQRWEGSNELRSYLALLNVPGGGDPILFSGQTNPVEAVSISPRDSLIAAADYQGRIRLWNLTNQTLVSRFAASDGALIRSLSFSPDGQQLATAGFDGGLGLWKVPGGQPVWRTNFSSNMRAVAFSPDGQLLAAGSKDDKLGLHSATNGQRLRVLTGSAAAIERLAFSPDEAWLASWAGGTDDYMVRVWRVADGSLAWMTYLINPGSYVFFPDSSALVVGPSHLMQAKSGLSVVNLPEGTVRYSLPGSNSLSLAVSPDGSFLAEGDSDRRIRIWRLDDRTLLRTIENNRGPVTTLTFTPDSKHLYTSSADETVKLWRVADGLLLNTIQGQFLDLSPDGITMVSKHTSDLSLDYWKLPGPVLDRAIEKPFQYDAIWGLTPDQRYAIVNERDTLRWWPLGDAKTVSYDQEIKGTTALAISPSGRYFAYGRLDANIFLARNPLGAWDAPQAPPRFLLAPQDAAASEGAPFLMPAQVAGAWPIRSQWLKNNQTILGATNLVLTIREVKTSDAGSYQLHLSNAHGAVTSPPALLRVVTPPQIMEGGPNDLVVAVSSPAKLTVTATGDGPLTYQWHFNDQLIPGATNDSFSLLSAQPEQAGYYSVTVAQPSGNRTSRTAFLDVQIPLQPRFSNTISGTLTALSFSSNQLLHIQSFQLKDVNWKQFGYYIWIYSWSLPDNRLSRISHFAAPYFTNSVFSGDGHFLAYAANPTSLLLWDILNNKEEGVLPTGPLGITALSPSGDLLAWNNYALLGVSMTQPWDLLWTRNEFASPASRPLAMVFSPDSQLLAILDRQGMISLRQVANGQPLRSWPSHDGPSSSFLLTPEHAVVLFSPDGSLLISTADDRRIRLWRVADGSLLRTLTGDFSEVQSMTVSPDGVILCVVRLSGVVECYEIATGLRFHLQTINSLSVRAAFSPDARLLAIAYGNGQVTLADNPLVHLNSPSRLSLQTSGNSHSLVLGLQGIIGHQYSIQTSSDLRLWTDLTNVVSLQSTNFLVDPNEKKPPIRFYRSLELRNTVPP